MPAEASLARVDSAGRAIFWISLAVYGAMELWIALRDRRAGIRRSAADPGVRAITASFMGGIALALLAARYVTSLELPGSGWGALLAGVFLIYAGMALRVWAVRTLGRFFRRIVVIQPDHRLITDGPYRYVRHPSYSGALLSMLGIGLALANVLSIALCVAVPLLGYAHRIPREEEALAAGLGGAYRAYASRTARLIPGLW